MITAHLSLGELVRLGFARPPRVLAGQGGLARAVSWVSALPASRARDYRPAPDEFLLLMAPYRNLSPLIQSLAQAGTAGLALQCDELPDQLATWAEQSGYPILRLPDDTDPVQLPRELIRLLVDRESGVVARQAEIYQRLTRISAENGGLKALVGVLREITGCGVVVHDKRLGVLAACAPPHVSSGWQVALEWTGVLANLPAEMRDRRRAAKINTATRQALPGGWARLVQPIIVHDIARGYLSLLRYDGVFDQLDAIALEQGAAACALELAKAKAISETRKRMTGDLIEAILTGTVGEAEAGRWAERAGYRREGAHVAMTLQWASPGAPTLRRLETIVSGEARPLSSQILVRSREDEIVVLYALDADKGLEDARQWAARVFELARAEFPEAALAIGIGRPSENLLGLRGSFREAEQAMALEHRLRQKRPQFYGELGVYRLLLPLQSNPDLTGFVQEVLGALVEYDRSQGTNLVETLRAYFEHNGNVMQTAEALFVHRNTLLYRLQRASEIGRFDLTSAPTRLALQLALCALEIVHLYEGASPSA